MDNAKMPKEKEIKGWDTSSEIYNKRKSYNQALYDFRLWQEKCLGKLEEVLAQVYCEEKHSKKVLDPELLQSIAQAIYNLFGGKG